MSRFAASFFKHFNKIRIRRQLLLVYLVAGILPMLVLSVYLVGNTRQLVLQQHYAQTTAENRRVKSILFAVTYLATNTANTIFFDNQLRDIVTTRYSNDSEVYKMYRNYTLMDTYLVNYTEISGITIYVTNETMLTSGRFTIVTEDIAQADWYRRAADSSSDNLWIVDNNLGQISNLHLVRKIPLVRTGEFAVLVIDISNNYLNLMINNNDIQTIMALDNNNIFFSEDAINSDQKLPFKIVEDNVQKVHTGTFLYGNNEAIYSASVQKAFKAVHDFQIVTIDSNALGHTRKVTLNIGLIVSISLIVPYFLIILFLNVFSKRIRTLRSEMHKVAEGDFNIIDSFDGRDELSDVFADMKIMIDCIQNLYKEIYMEKLSQEKLVNRQQQIEFELLASQINPHFLFNTLETIRMKAYINGNSEVAHITKLLGKFMRRLLEVGHAPVTLASELEYMQTYIDIQIFRHDKISYGITVKEDVNTEQYLILPLLLQPLVENAVIHGLENNDKNGRIKITIENRGNKLAIIVDDNGIGMTQDKIQTLRENLEISGNGQVNDSIGFSNVHQRIKLYYGIEYGLTIDSKQDEGTVVIMLLPADGKGVINHECLNR